jgi:hypothetical protein
MAEFPVNANTKPAEDNIDRLIAKLRACGKEAGLTEKEIEDIVKSTKKMSTEGTKNINAVNKSMGDLGNVANKVGNYMLGMFAVDKIKDFIGEIVRVTAEFQKFEAVLTNTLGSKGGAQRALNEIKQFAKTTPFEVAQITAAYVRWANQGLQPTIDRMKKLGDVSSALGADFEQTAEAFKDLMVGQTKRIEEVGISATQMNGKIQLSFKGVNLEIEKNAEGVQKALDVYSQLEGVLGTSDAIINTLGGQISNLKDSWTIFLDTLGQGNSGVLSSAVRVMNQWLDVLTDVVKTQDQLVKEERLNQATEAIDTFKSQVETFKNFTEAYDAYVQAYAREREALINTNAEIGKELESGNEARRQEYNDNWDRINQIDISVDALKEYVDQLKKEEAQKKKTEADKIRQAMLDAEKKRLEALRKEYEKLAKMREEDASQFLIDQEKYWQQLFQRNDNELNQRANDQYKRGSDLTDNFVPEEDAPEERMDVAGDPYAYDRRMEALASFKDYSIQAFGEIFNAQQFYIQQEIAMLEQRYKYEMSLAGNNDDAKRKITEDYNKKQAQLLQKQADAQQRAAIFEIAVNEGPAIAKTAKNLGFPWAIPFIAAIGLLFASQINRAKGVKAPKYLKDGEFDIEGPGTETSDSIPAMLSKHESVVSARRTRQFPDIVQAIVENDYLTYADLSRIVDKHLPNQYQHVIVHKAGGDGGENSALLKKLISTVENKKETRINLDENGFGHWVGKKSDWTKVLNKRYSMS